MWHRKKRNDGSFSTCPALPCIFKNGSQWRHNGHSFRTHPAPASLRMAHCSEVQELRKRRNDASFSTTTTSSEPVSQNSCSLSDWQQGNRTSAALQAWSLHDRLRPQFWPVQTPVVTRLFVTLNNLPCTTPLPCTEPVSI